MKVRELLEQLQQLNPDSEVYVYVSEDAMNPDNYSTTIKEIYPHWASDNDLIVHIVTGDCIRC